MAMAFRSLKNVFGSLLFLLLLFVNTAQTAPPDGYKFLALDKAHQQAAVEKKPMLLYFGRYGCTTCRKMHKEVFIDAGVNEYYNKHFILAYVDTESGNRIHSPNGERTTDMQFATRSRILGTPTFIYFDKDQKPLFKKAGFQSIEQMLKYSQFIVDEQYKNTSLKDYLAAK